MFGFVNRVDKVTKLATVNIQKDTNFVYFSLNIDPRLRTVTSDFIFFKLDDFIIN